MPAMDESQQRWFDEWRNEVAQRIHGGDFCVMRDAAYDRVLGILFPEMSESLSKPFGKRPAVPEIRWNDSSKQFEPAFQQRRPRPSDFLTNSVQGGLPTRGADGGSLASWLLQGAELEAWKKANPDSAKAWEPLLKRHGR